MAVVNHGTRPMDELYFELKPQSRNEGVVDYNALIAGHPQNVAQSSGQGFALYRIGDAVSARNTHAAIYDALRLMKDV
jgi:N-methyl-L-proline demethylase